MLDKKAITPREFNLKNIRIQDFRCFQDLEIQLHPHMNVFVGANASGKTALLEGIKIALSLAIDEIVAYTNLNFFNYPIINKNYPLLSIENFRIQFFKQHSEVVPVAQIRVEGFNNTSAKSSIKSFGWWMQYSREPAHAGAVNEDIRNVILEIGLHKDDPEWVLPIVQCYSTDRLTEKNNINEELTGGTRLKGYTEWRSGILMKSPTFKKWVLNHTLMAFQGERVGKSEAEAAPALSVIRDAILTILPECIDMYYHSIHNEVYYTFRDGRDLPFSYWSDGVKNLILLVTDIALRCTILNPDMGIRANETPGIVLIDEVDLHLHPSWQRTVLPGLAKAFPNIQFIVTTHSPQVLSSVAHESVFVLENFKLRETQPYVEGRDSNAILSEAFDVPVVSPESQQEIDAIYAAIDAGNASEAKRLLEIFAAKRSDSDLEVLRMQTFLDFL